MYEIISSRVGTPGDTFTPDDETNVQALLDGGFIKEKNPTNNTKSVKVNLSQQVPDDLQIDTE